jgi:NADP-dependent 3-hydroxy acid dehydrogenase YdfG
LGQAFAFALAQAGAKVAVIARSAEQLARTVRMIEQTGGQALALTADVTQRAEVERAVAEVQTQFGPVDILVNNAGVSGPTGPIWENDLAEWWRCMEVNTKGALLCAGAVFPGMIARRRGRIINVSSAAGSSGGANRSAYITSKTAVTRLTEVMAEDSKNHGVSVFAIEPGTVRTAMTEELMASASMGSLKKIFESGNDVSPQHAAELVVWLASGQGDSLSGLFLDRREDLNRLLARQGVIRELGLHTLRVITFDRRMAALHIFANAFKLVRKRLRGRSRVW